MGGRLGGSVGHLGGVLVLRARRPRRQQDPQLEGVRIRGHGVHHVYVRGLPGVRRRDARVHERAAPLGRRLEDRPPPPAPLWPRPGRPRARPAPRKGRPAPIAPSPPRERPAMIATSPPSCSPADWSPHKLAPLLAPGKKLSSSRADRAGAAQLVFDAECTDSPSGPGSAAAPPVVLDGVELRLLTATPA